jgi:peptide/nickel transport system substrate-binding protein
VDPCYKFGAFRIEQLIKKSIVRTFFLLIIDFTLLIYCNFQSGGAEIIEGIEDFPLRLDPALALKPEEIRINSSIYESLVVLDSDRRTIKPCLATKWVVSADQQVYTFTIQKNLFFHDLTPVNALALSYGFQWQLSRNPSFPLFAMIDRVEVMDSLNLKIILKYPYAPFLYALASPVGLKAISKKAIENYGDEIVHHPTGTGPFYLTQWKENDNIILKFFRSYRHSETNLDIIKYQCYKDYEVLQQKLENNEINTFFMVPGFFIDRLKWLGVVDYQVAPPTSTIFIGFNNKTPPFNIRNIRRAVSYALNQEKMVSGIFRGNSVAARGPLPPVLFDYDKAALHVYNPEKARQLMKQAGYPEGFTTTFYYLDRFRARNTIFEAIGHDLENVGVHLRMIPFYSWEDLVSASQSDSSQMFWIGWGTDMLGDAENFLYSLFYSGSPYNILHYRNEQVDRWLEESRREPDLDKRHDLYRCIIDRIREDVPIISMYHVIQIYAYNRHKIRNLPLDPYGNINYQRIVLTDQQEN